MAISRVNDQQSMVNSQRSIVNSPIMPDLFNGIVQLLNSFCRATGLSYYEVNILLYTFIIPASWWALTWWRVRRLHWIWLLHIGTPLLYYAEKERLVYFSQRFYEANTAALMHLSKDNEGQYIRISLLLGVAVPLLLYALLLLLPKPWLLRFYLLLLAGNVCWYLWALSCF